MSALVPGTRVVVRNAGHLSGQTGVVVEMAEKLLNGHDCAVALDIEAKFVGLVSERDRALCFYAHELRVAS